MKILVMGFFLATTTPLVAQLAFFSFGNSFSLNADENLLAEMPILSQWGVDSISGGAGGVIFEDISGTSWAAGLAAAWGSGVNDPGGNGFSVSLNTTGFQSLVWRLDYRATATGPAAFSAVQYRIAAGLWMPLGSAPLTLINDGNYHTWSYDASGVIALENIQNLEIQWLLNPGTGTGTFRIDNLQLTGVVGVPEASSRYLIGLGFGLLLWTHQRKCSRYKTPLN
jgi:hypothetical protein